MRYLRKVDFVLEKKWREVLNLVSTDYGGDLDVMDVLYLIGVQELGQGFRSFSKQEKLELIHIATCAVLSPYGYYNLAFQDQDGWPHYESKDSLPHLEEKEQELLLKEAIIAYFTEE